MAILLHKTLVDKVYDLYIKVVFYNDQRIDPETEELCCFVITKVYESQDHLQAGFRPMLRRTEIIRGDETHIVPFVWNTQEGYDDILRYIHEYIVNHIEWYAGATIVAPLGEETPGETTVVPVDATLVAV